MKTFRTHKLFDISLIIIAVVFILAIRWEWSGEFVASKHHPTPKDFEQKHITKTIQTGKSSWYNYSLPGYPNYSKTHFTAASRDYPRGTMLRVCKTDKETDIKGLKEITWEKAKRKGAYYFQPEPNEQNIYKCVDVRVNDYVENPNVIIDLSSRAFASLAPLSKGIIQVEITEI